MPPTHYLLALLLLTTTAQAQAPPSYASHVRPFLTRYCVSCHTGADAEAALVLDSFAGLAEGGKRGRAVVPGKPDESLLVRMLEGKQNPAMPPRKSRQPSKGEVALVRAWVLAGAKDDSAAVRVALPAVAPRVKVATPVAAVAYAPDGKTLAAAGRAEVLFLDAATGELRGHLPAARDRVTAVAYSGRGDQIAVAAGTAGEGHEVRLAPAAAGLPAGPARLVARHADTIHAVAFSPDGRLLATCSYDRLVKLWHVATGKELRVLSDHSDSVYGLAFSPDGRLLASGGADRAVKVWDVATGRRLYTLGDATDWVYAVAFSPDGRHLAAAGVDRSIRVWQVDAKAGRLVHSAFAHEGPVTRLVYSADGRSLYSLGEDGVVKAWDAARLTERKVHAAQPELPLALAVRPDGRQLAVGRFDGVLALLDEATGKEQKRPLPLPAGAVRDRFVTRAEVEPNDSPRTGQSVTLPVSLAGEVGRAGDVDWFRFELKAGQEVGVQAVTAGSKLDALLQLIDPDGGVVAEGGGLLGYRADRAGIYALGVRDREYRGGPGMRYRLHVGDVPVVTAVFPLGLRQGTTATVRLEGVHLGKQRTAHVQALPDAAVGARLPVPVPAGALGAPTVVVGEFAEVKSEEKGGLIATPGTANGRLAAPGASQTWRFAAKKGQRLILEVSAARLGSPLDSTIEVLDAAGKPLPRATLRGLARTYTTFRDHDSRGPGIRIETWGELAVNDYLLVGGELLRIRALPRNPDDDCQFFSEAGQRLGFLGTTPTHHSQGTPMVKVAVHPPGSTFPPNGLPVVSVFWRNDDGGPGLGKDSRLVFDPPADGTYQLRVGDARGEGGPAYGYRLTVRPPRPDFRVNYSVAGTVSRGGAVPVRVNVQRIDEFDGVIDLRLTNLPKGFHAPATNVPAGEPSTAFALYADADAERPTQWPPLQLEARATIGGKDVVRKATATLPRTVVPGEITTRTEERAVTIRPGGEARVTVTIERGKGFTGRVPIEVQGLPHGVRVLDVGLNGILITPEQTRRTFVLYCEPWVPPMMHPIVVLARREGKGGAEHAARSVELRVGK